MDACENIESMMQDMGKRAKVAGRILSAASPAAKETALRAIASLLRTNAPAIQEANEKDLAAAQERGMDGPRVDRLRLTDSVIEDMAKACEEVAAMDDPVGAIETMWQRPNGLQVGRMRIPLGTIAIIYESRPNVTVDAAILCLKAGNSVILRGGSEALHSNMALAKIVHSGLQQAGLPEDSAQVVPTTDRAAVKAMLKLEEYIDVIIPRGGETLIRAVVQDATMPVLKHYKGVVHAYVDKLVDEEQAVELIFNSKVQRPGVCNALEGLLVHRDVADSFLPKVAARLGKEAGVAFKCCPHTLPLMGATAEPATDEDWGTEFHALCMIVKRVDSQTEAQDYIAQHTSNHTEIICTTDHNRAMRFLREVDASMVGINTSTRFNDGGQLGLGAEMGISTSKLHSYGPMGVRELTTTKFVALGQGQVRS